MIVSKRRLKRAKQKQDRPKVDPGFGNRAQRRAANRRVGAVVKEYPLVVPGEDQPG